MKLSLELFRFVSKLSLRMFGECDDGMYEIFVVPKQPHSITVAISAPNLCVLEE